MPVPSPSPVASRPRGVDEVCRRPLSEYCSGARCPTFEQSREDLRRRREGGTCDALLAELTAGSCAERTAAGRRVRYTHARDTFYTSATSYFRESGDLIGVHIDTDAPTFCGGEYFQEEFGEVPACTRVVEEDFCR